jgi:transposase
MIPVPSGVRVFITAGATDMRRGMNGLALQVQERCMKRRRTRRRRPISNMGFT